jgi:hypothetical protein
MGNSPNTTQSEMEANIHIAKKIKGVNTKDKTHTKGAA